MTEEEMRALIRDEMAAVVNEAEEHPDATAFVSDLQRILNADLDA